MQSRELNNRFGDATFHSYTLSDRTSLQSSSFELHTHLSHALVRYLGLSSPEELAGFGLTSAGDLVDFISRVCLFPQISISA